jgi:hypothetical protein
MWQEKFMNPLAELMQSYKDNLQAAVYYAAMILRDTCRGIITPERFAAVGVEFAIITGKPMTIEGVQEVIHNLQATA